MDPDDGQYVDLVNMLNSENKFLARIMSLREISKEQEQTMNRHSTLRSHHTTSEGETIPIAGMLDSHLISTIKLFSKKAAMMTMQVSNVPKARSARGAALYGDFEVDSEAYQSEIAKWHDRVGPYMAEALCRGGDVMERAQKVAREVLGRSSMDSEAPTVSIPGAVCEGEYPHLLGEEEDYS